MLKNVKHAYLGNTRQLTFTERIHTHITDELMRNQNNCGSKSPTKFRVTQKISLCGKKIKSQTQSPQVHQLKSVRSSTYRKIAGNKNDRKQGLLIVNTNDFIEQRVSSERKQTHAKIKIKSNGLLDLNQFVQRKHNEKETTTNLLNTYRKQSQPRSLKKKIAVSVHTCLEEQEMKKYPVFYKGKRKIQSKKDFTDDNGCPIIKEGDSIAYRYEILHKLGEGAFGKVYKAIDHKKNETVALKIIKAVPKLNEQSKIQIQMLESVLEKDPQGTHNIIKIKGSFTFRGHACISYQLLKINLYEYLKSNDFTPVHEKVIVKFAIQILNSLDFLSKLNIVHCDIKPENIMLKEENKTGVKLIDLGSGCFCDKQIYTYIQSRFYRAPEVILGHKYTPAIDMWSFGCVIAELWLGIPIFPGDNEDQQMLMFMEVLGFPPRSMLEQAPRRKKFFKDNFQCRILQNPKCLRLPKSLCFQKLLLTKDNKNFINFIKRCLEWDPTKRMKPKQALLHEWILENLPPNIRNRHIYEVTGENQ